MPQQATRTAGPEFAERDPAPPQDVDYDAEYRALDLPPGAALWEIEDRARLLSAAFHPSRLPGMLRLRAVERAIRITAAADRLSQYWHSHGAAPPCSAAAPAERAAPRLYLVHNAEPLPASLDTSARSGGEQSAELRVAIASGRVLNQGAGRPQDPQKPRPTAMATSVLFKLAMAALVVAAVVRVQQYRADHPWLSAYSDPRTMSASGMPAAPPARWAGWDLPGRMVFGAAAPAIASRQRQD